MAKLKNKKQTTQAITANIDEFVIEKSKKPIKMGTILLIENCSSGEKKIIKILKKSKVFLLYVKIDVKN
jgi:hypothetical protein